MQHILVVGLQHHMQHVQALLGMTQVKLSLLADLHSLNLQLLDWQENDKPLALVVVLPVLERRSEQHQTLQNLRQLNIPWLALIADDEKAAMQYAYRAGAEVVIPLTVEPTLICDLVGRMLMQAEQQKISSDSQNAIFRHYQPRERIHLDSDVFLLLQHGTVRITVCDAEGEERTLGFASSGEMLATSTEEDITLVAVAHSKVMIRVLSWSDVLSDETCLCALRRRMESMLSWRLALTEPSVERRLLQSLRSLSRRAAVVSGEGALLDFRLTHAELAAAIGATRTTVTRSIGKLRRQGYLNITRGSTGDGGRILLEKSF